jgi:hypothetical protein
MPEPITPRRAQREAVLSAEQKYEICLKIITGELASREAVAQAKVDARRSWRCARPPRTLRSWRSGRCCRAIVTTPGQASELARLQAEAQLLPLKEAP